MTSSYGSLPFFRPSSHDLSYDIIHTMLQNIDTSAMSDQEYAEFMDYIYNNSPFSPSNIDQTLAANPQLNPCLPTSSLMPNATYSPQQPPLWIPMQTNPQYQYPPPSLILTTTYYPVYYPIQQFIPVGYIAVDEVRFDYEDMLEMQETIGRVNVGLSEETISKNLKTSNIQVVKDDEGEVCAVCQEEYKVKEMIGTLECGHRYHENCIKEWLHQKNICPICKATALFI